MIIADRNAMLHDVEIADEMCLVFTGAGPANPCGYANNNPVNFTDPSGLDVGMHWISQQIFKEYSKKISTSAFKLCDGFHTDPDVYVHTYDTWFPGGIRVSHADYNKAIREWVGKAIEKDHEFLTESTAKEMISMFTERGFSEEAKKVYGLSDEAFDVISRYRKGFFESVDLAHEFVKIGGEKLKRTTALKELVQYAQITSAHGDDLAKIEQIAGDKTLERFKKISASLKTASPQAKTVMAALKGEMKSNASGWLRKFLGKQVGQKGARVLLGAVGYFFLARDARAGALGEGHHPELTGIAGAADNVAYNAMFGDAVEAAHKGTIDFAAQFVTPPAPGITRRGLLGGIEPLGADIVSGTNAVGIKSDIPDAVPEKKYKLNWFWRLLGYTE